MNVWKIFPTSNHSPREVQALDHSSLVTSINHWKQLHDAYPTAVFYHFLSLQSRLYHCKEPNLRFKSLRWSFRWSFRWPLKVGPAMWLRMRPCIDRHLAKIIRPTEPWEWVIPLLIGLLLGMIMGIKLRGLLGIISQTGCDNLLGIRMMGINLAGLLVIIDLTGHDNH